MRLELISSGGLPVVLDLHAFGVIDDDSEIAFLRKYGRNIQDRPEENKSQNGKRDRPQYDQADRILVARDFSVREDGAYSGGQDKDNKPCRGTQELKSKVPLLIDDRRVLEEEFKNAHV